MVIDATKLTQLVEGEITLVEYIKGTTTPIDDAVLASAQQALSLLAANKHLINLATEWLNLPITFASTPNRGEGLQADQNLPEELKPIDGMNDLKALLCDCDNCKC